MHITYTGNLHFHSMQSIYTRLPTSADFSSYVCNSYDLEIQMYV